MKSWDLSRVWIVFLFLAAALYLTGIFSQVYLGDEAYHFRIAKNYADFGRLVVQPAYSHVPEMGYQITGPTLWYQGLAALWNLFHSRSLWIAQAYQVFFYAALAVLAWVLARSLGYSRQEAFWASFLVMTCPMVAAFSILLYLDVPMVAVSFLTMIFIVRGRTLWAAVSFAGLVLFKESGFFLLPAFLFILLIRNKTWGRNLKSILLFAGTAFFLLLPDILFRLKHFGFVYYSPPDPRFLNRELDYWYSPSSLIHDPVGSIEYLGLTIPWAFSGYLVFKKAGPKDWILSLTALSISCSVLYLFSRTLEMRYFMPAVCLTAVLGAKSVSFWNPVWKSILVFLCILQFIGTCGIVYRARRIPPAIQEGYDFIRTQTPEGALLLYPEENITTYTGRPMVWVRIPKLAKLFWNNNAEDIEKIAKESPVDFVVIPFKRVYDDARVHHIGGYPRSFVEKLEQGRFPWAKLLFANSGIGIWQIQRGNR